MKRLIALLMVMLYSPFAWAEGSVRWIDGGNADRVHLRKEPSKAAESLGLYYTGTSGIVIAEEEEWTQVLIMDAMGYVMSSYLSNEAVVSRGPWSVVDNPNSTWVNLRFGASVNSEVAMCLDNGAAVRVLGETAAGWSYVDCEGIKGYILTSMLMPADDAAFKQKTIRLAEMGEKGYIHRCIAPNGQDLYFNAVAEEPFFKFEDVNFDGLMDIVIITGRWAKCDTALFYVHDDEEGYVLVQETAQGEGLMNYVLYPESGLVGTYIANGHAGLLHAANLYRWEGKQLRQIRSAVSDEWSESVFDGDTYTQIIHGDILHVKVLDHAAGNDGSVLYERIIPMDQVWEGEDYQRIYDEEMAALWQGLR